jgi:hypothetical protein
MNNNGEYQEFVDSTSRGSRKNIEAIRTQNPDLFRWMLTVNLIDSDIFKYLYGLSMFTRPDGQLNLF